MNATETARREVQDMRTRDDLSAWEVGRTVRRIRQQVKDGEFTLHQLGTTEPELSFFEVKHGSVVVRPELQPQ